MALNNCNLKASENNADSNNFQEVTLHKQFMANYRTILSNVVNDVLINFKYIDNTEIIDRIKKLSEYYTLKQRPLQGELMLLAYEMLEDPKRINEEIRHQAYTLACAMEIGASLLFIIDDIEDGSKTRSGQTCWHLLPDVGSLAMNDVIIQKCFVHNIMQQSFPEPLSTKLINLSNELYLLTSIGQHMDAVVSNSKNYVNFTRKFYSEMHKLKYVYAFQSPIHFAFILAKLESEESLQYLCNISQDIVMLWNIYNDMMDFFYGDGSASGKSSTDIQKGKCSWAAIAVLERCNAEQREIFEKNYGSWDPTCVQKIRELYTQLQLPQLYIKERQACCEVIVKKIRELPKNASPGTNFYLKLFDILSSVTEISIDTSRQ